MAKGSGRKSQRKGKSVATKRPARRKKRPKRERKECLVVSVIGKKGSTERKHADQLLDEIISPVLSRLGYDVYRIDKIRLGARIDDKLVTKLMEVDLVVADVTYPNPNVYWELGARRAWNRPALQMAREGTPLPFDVGFVDTLFYGNIGLVKPWRKAKADLRRFVRDIESGESKVRLFDGAFRRLAFAWSKENSETILRWSRLIMQDYCDGTIDALSIVRKEVDPEADDAILALANIVNKPIRRLKDHWYVLEGVSGEMSPGQVPRLLDNVFAAIKRLLDDAIGLSMEMMHWKPSEDTVLRVSDRLSALVRAAEKAQAMKPQEKKS